MVFADYVLYPGENLTEVKPPPPISVAISMYYNRKSIDQNDPD
jgi:hypothetical protein